MLRAVVLRLVYPVVVAATILHLFASLRLPPSEWAARQGLFVAVLVLVLALLEAVWPLQARWRMTWPRFLRRDLPFMLIGTLTIGLGNAVGAWIVQHPGLASPTGWLAGLPLAASAALSLLITDGLWYALHRACHEARGSVGTWLWRVHAAHHLPGEVYVLMHAVAHPINTLLVRLLLTMPPWLLGVSPEALFVAQAITSVQGLVSHFNLDSRVGCVNRLLVGTELHRWHHAAGVQGNYAAVLSIWDQLFGSFVYLPGRAPDRLGMDDPTHWPRDTEFGAILLEPLRWDSSQPLATGAPETHAPGVDRRTRSTMRGRAGARDT